MKAFLRTSLLVLPALLLGLLPASSPAAQFGISVNISTAPPVLPVYAQPPCPDEGYLWEPGYWAWGADGYYWVPGVWVEPPQPGLFWTPGYWGFVNGNYMWNEGYWGPEVGFYGGINYGFGYPGEGFYGGMWQGNAFRYNVAVWHVGGGFRNTYRAPVAWHSPWHSRASFNGGRGIPARPTPQDERAMHAHHYQPTAQQLQQRQVAARNPEYQYKTNHGKPQHAAMTRVGAAPARNQQRPAANARQQRPQTRPARQAHPQSRPAARPESRTQSHPAARTETRTQTRPETRTAARPETRTAARPETRTQTRPQSRPESRPQSRAQARTESRPAARPEARPASRPAARPQSRHAARPASHPESHPAPEKPHAEV